MRRPLSGWALGALALGSLVAGAALADQVVADDQIVQGSVCVGFDCVNDEPFAFDTIRLKENNTRLAFQDTTDPLLGPGNDWTLTANDSASAGLSRFSVDDVSAGTVPLWIAAGAPDHTLYVSATGAVGIGTDLPEPGIELQVAGNLRIDGDLYLGSVGRGGSVPASEFAATRSATVPFASPWPGDYAIALTPVAASEKGKLTVTLVSRDANGFTFAVKGKPSRYLEVLWSAHPLAP